MPTPKPRPTRQRRRPKRLKPDITPAHPNDVLLGLIREKFTGGQFLAMELSDIALAVIALDRFNKAMGLAEMRLRVSPELAAEIDRQRATQVVTSPDLGKR